MVHFNSQKHKNSYNKHRWVFLPFNLIDFLILTPKKKTLYAVFVVYYLAL